MTTNEKRPSATACPVKHSENTARSGMPWHVFAGTDDYRVLPDHAFQSTPQVSKQASSPAPPVAPPGLPGYHLRDFPRGEVGEISKIEEEVLELRDAMEQHSKIMALVELSDIYGAIELFLGRHFPGTSMEDLKIMSQITQRAFLNKRRSP